MSNDFVQKLKGFELAFSQVIPANNYNAAICALMSLARMLDKKLGSQDQLDRVESHLKDIFENGLEIDSNAHRKMFFEMIKSSEDNPIDTPDLEEKFFGCSNSNIEKNILEDLNALKLVPELRKDDKLKHIYFAFSAPDDLQINMILAKYGIEFQPSSVDQISKIMIYTPNNPLKGLSFQDFYNEILTICLESAPITFQKIVWFNHNRNARIKDVLSFKVSSESLKDCLKEMNIDQCSSNIDKSFYYSVNSTMTEPDKEIFNDVKALFSNEEKNQTESYQRKIYNLILEKVWGDPSDVAFIDSLELELKEDANVNYALEKITEFSKSKLCFPMDTDLSCKLLTLQKKLATKGTTKNFINMEELPKDLNDVYKYFNLSPKSEHKELNLDSLKSIATELKVGLRSYELKEDTLTSCIHIKNAKNKDVFVDGDNFYIIQGLNFDFNHLKKSTDLLKNLGYLKSMADKLYAIYPDKFRVIRAELYFDYGRELMLSGRYDNLEHIFNEALASDEIKDEVKIHGFAAYYLNVAKITCSNDYIESAKSVLAEISHKSREVHLYLKKCDLLSEEIKDSYHREYDIFAFENKAKMQAEISRLYSQIKSPIFVHDFVNLIVRVFHSRLEFVYLNPSHQYLLVHCAKEFISKISDGQYANLDRDLCYNILNGMHADLSFFKVTKSCDHLDELKQLLDELKQRLKVLHCGDTSDYINVDIKETDLNSEDISGCEKVDIKKIDLRLKFKIVRLVNHLHKFNMANGALNDNSFYLKGLKDLKIIGFKESNSENINYAKQKDLSFIQEIIGMQASSSIKNIEQILDYFIGNMTVDHVLLGIFFGKESDNINLLKNKLHELFVFRYKDNSLNIAKLESKLWQNILFSTEESLVTQLDEIIDFSKRNNYISKAKFYFEAKLKYMIYNDENKESIIIEFINFLNFLGYTSKYLWIDMYAKIFTLESCELNIKLLNKIASDKIPACKFVHMIIDEYPAQRDSLVSKLNQDAKDLFESVMSGSTGVDDEIKETKGYMHDDLNGLHIIKEHLRFIKNKVQLLVDISIVKGCDKTDQSLIKEWFIMARVFFDHFMCLFWKSEKYFPANLYYAQECLSQLGFNVGRTTQKFLNKLPKALKDKLPLSYEKGQFGFNRINDLPELTKNFINELHKAGDGIFIEKKDTNQFQLDISSIQEKKEKFIEQHTCYPSIIKFLENKSIIDESGKVLKEQFDIPDDFGLPKIYLETVQKILPNIKKLQDRSDIGEFKIPDGNFIGDYHITCDLPFNEIRSKGLIDHYGNISHNFESKIVDLVVKDENFYHFTPETEDDLKAIACYIFGVNKKFEDLKVLQNNNEIDKTLFAIYNLIVEGIKNKVGTNRLCSEVKKQYFSGEALKDNKLEKDWLTKSNRYQMLKDKFSGTNVEKLNFARIVIEPQEYLESFKEFLVQEGLTKINDHVKGGRDIIKYALDNDEFSKICKSKFKGLLQYVFINRYTIYELIQSEFSDFKKKGDSTSAISIKINQEINKDNENREKKIKEIYAKYVDKIGIKEKFFKYWVDGGCNMSITKDNADHFKELKKHVEDYSRSKVKKHVEDFMGFMKDLEKSIFFIQSFQIANDIKHKESLLISFLDKISGSFRVKIELSSCKFEEFSGFIKQLLVGPEQGKVKELYNLLVKENVINKETSRVNNDFESKIKDLDIQCISKSVLIKFLNSKLSPKNYFRDFDLLDIMSKVMSTIDYLFHMCVNKIDYLFHMCVDNCFENKRYEITIKAIFLRQEIETSFLSKYQRSFNEYLHNDKDSVPELSLDQKTTLKDFIKLSNRGKHVSLLKESNVELIDKIVEIKKLLL